jgi:hypothetical protein
VLFDGAIGYHRAMPTWPAPAITIFKICGRVQACLTAAMAETIYMIIKALCIHLNQPPVIEERRLLRKTIVYLK